MKLQFKNQKFQADAAKAVVDVFAGQPNITNNSYLIDRGINNSQQMVILDEVIGQRNAPIQLHLDEIILKNLQKIQRDNQLKPSEKLEGRFNLTIEMETGVGKTYTYIKTMYELNKHYGWSKFIVVVPSIAIREGVYKTFQITEDHFAEEYGKKIKFFIYNSKQLTNIEHFASDSSINVMIINVQAFNAKGKDARKISMQLDEFRSRRPIDVIAATNPILIIDEPQVVEGKTAKENLKYFKPLMTLRYSATHRKDSIYNMVYRLDALEAYNKHLVKKIAVKGITESGSTATEGFVYLERINLSKSAPTATIHFDYKGKTGIRKVTRTVNEGFNLYEHSGELDEYKNNFVVKFIDGRGVGSIEFLNGLKVYAGDIIGKVNEEQLRRIQIRETIKSHIEREEQLFKKGIKVLSLFFIDEVAHYKQYDSTGQPVNGDFANWFEEEYKNAIAEYQPNFFNEDYLKYLQSITAEKTHAGYFSIDNKGRMTNSKVSARETISDDISAYDLIMKNKELLLDQNPQKSPVRFIFSHSALREGWDNPNVFQICTLKQGGSDVRKRQEVGRGLRLCVNQQGERMDENVLAGDVHNVNVLTVIASESYDEFARKLQTELAETISDRPRAVSVELFIDKMLKSANGEEVKIDERMARSIFNRLIKSDYLDDDYKLTDKYYDDKSNDKLEFTDEVSNFKESVIGILDSIYNSNVLKPDDARSDTVKVHIDKDKLDMPEFKALWSKINSRSMYEVKFNSDELVAKSIDALNKHLNVSKMYFRVESGELVEIESKDALLAGTAFSKGTSGTLENANTIKASYGTKYDLVGKLVEETKLTRKTIVKILTGIDKNIFNQFQYNPEEFILKTGNIINDEKATTIIQHITYQLTGNNYTTDVFTDNVLKGKLGVNVIPTKKHLYDHLLYDSKIEREFAESLENNPEIVVYVKLPSGFYISTPVGKYNPDWAIAFREGSVKHIYFVAETKGSMSTMQLRLIENTKIECARKHFESISTQYVKYDVVQNYSALLKKVMQ